MDNHGAEVDIWSVGNFILESTSFTLDLSPKLVKLGTWMQNVAPDAQDAVEAYCQKKAFYFGNMLPALMDDLNIICSPDITISQHGIDEIEVMA